MTIAPARARQGDEQLELAHRQRERATGGEHESLAEPDLELARIQGAGAVLVHGHRSIAWLARAHVKALQTRDRLVKKS